MLTGDEHIHLQPLGKGLLEVGDHPQAALFFGHETRRLAADIHVNAIAFDTDHGAAHHLSSGAMGLVVVESRQKGFFVKVEIVDAPRRGLGAGLSGSSSLGSTLLTRVRAQQVGHGEALHGPQVKQLVVVSDRSACRCRNPVNGSELSGSLGSCSKRRLSRRRLRGWLVLADHQHLGRLTQGRQRLGACRHWARRTRGHGPG